MPSLEVWSLLVSVGILITAIAALIPVYSRLIAKRREPAFELQRFQEILNPFNQPKSWSIWNIRLFQPKIVMRKCSVSYNDVKLPWWDRLDEPYYERFVDASGGNVRIPKEIEKDKAIVIVRDGKKILQKKKFQDIPIVRA